MGEVLALGWGVYLYCGCAIFAGTMLQRLAGQGFGLLAAPLTVLVVPDFLPATLLLIGGVVGFGATAVDMGAITKKELVPGFTGRTLGAVLAAWIAATIADPGIFSILVAGMVYLGIALSIIGLRVAIVPASLFSAGVVAGIMGTLTAVGAPPMALLYQHEEQRRSAGMQNIFFAWGMVVSILALTVAGLVGIRHLLLAAALVPFAFAALRVSATLARRVAKAQIRPYALTLAGAAATVLLVRQLL